MGTEGLCCEDSNRRPVSSCTVLARPGGSGGSGGLAPSLWPVICNNMSARSRHLGTLPGILGLPLPALGKHRFRGPDAFLRQQIAAGAACRWCLNSDCDRLTAPVDIDRSTTTVATPTTTRDHASSCSEPPWEQREPCWEQSHLWFHAKLPIQITRQVSQATVNKPPAAPQAHHSNPTI